MSNDDPVDGVYLIKERIGEGGMAEIYRVEVDLDAFDYSMLYAYTQADGETHAQRQAQARELNRKLEKKDLDPDTVRGILEAQGMAVPGRVAALKLAKSGADVERFDAEWQYLMCLNHPNVISVYGGGVWRGHPYYVMEHLTDTVPMKEVLALSLLGKLELMCQAGEGLAYLHKHEIVHRDVKPGNVMIVRRKEGLLAKVVDLGIAKAMDGSIADVLPDARPDAVLDGSPGETRSDQALGSKRYMAPEQILSPQTVDHRADQYGLATAIYEITTGYPPFPWEMSYVEIVRSVLKGVEPPPANVKNPQLPGSLTEIISRAMARKPEARYPDMNAMLAALAQLLSDLRADALPRTSSETSIEG